MSSSAPELRGSGADRGKPCWSSPLSCIPSWTDAYGRSLVAATRSSAPSLGGPLERGIEPRHLALPVLAPRAAAAPGVL